VLALALLGGGLSLAANRFAGEDGAAADGAAVAAAPGNPVAPARQQDKPDAQAQLDALRRDLQRALHEIDALKSRLEVTPAKVKLFRGKPVDFWIDQLNDFDPSYRIEAVKVLGIIAAQEERAVLPVLAERVKDKSAKVADEAALALAKGGKAAVPWLLKLVEVDLPPGEGRRLAEQVRIRAIVGLRHVGPEAKEAVPALTQALKHSKDELGQAAIAALRDIGPAARAAVPALIDVLARHLDDKESHVRNAVAQALMAIKPETASLLPESAHPLGVTFYQPVTSYQATLRRDDPPGLWEKALQSLKKKYSEKKEP
jgi:HEAT repeat protein